MSEIKVNSIKGVAASTAALTINNTDGTCTANITNNLSNRRLTINGAMTIAQRGVSSTSTGYQTCDRIQAARGGGAITQAQVDISSSDTPYSLGFRKAFKVTNSTAASAAGNYRDIRYYVEAQDVVNSGWNSESSSSNITLSFWARSSVAQTFYYFIYVPDSSKHFVVSFALSANTWTKVTKTIPGASGVTINNDNGNGLNIQIAMWYGSNFTTSGQAVDTWGTWNGSSRVPDMTSTWAATTDATFELTGLQLEVGSVATDFEHRSYAQEISLCERYLQVIAEGSNRYIATTFAYNTNLCIGCFTYKTQMRTAPSMVQTTGTNYYFLAQNNTINYFTQFEALSHVGKDQSGIYPAQSAINVTQGQAGGISTVDAGAKLMLQAEL